MTNRWQRVALVLFIVALGAFVRVKAALELPTDLDEPVYVGVGVRYARAMQAGEWSAIPQDKINIEHPALVKLLYGGGMALLKTDADDGQTVSRMISVFFGVALVALMTWVEPFAGLALALHTMHTKYTSQAYLEALPAFTSALCVVAMARSAGGRDRWFWLSAVALGATAAGKYTYLVAGLAVLVPRLRDVERGRPGWRDLLLYGLIALSVLIALDPPLWPNPVGRLVESLTFHRAYSQSAEVTRHAYPWWKPLDYMSHSFPVQWHPDVFLFPLDELIFGLGVAGLVWLAWPTRVGLFVRVAWARWRGRPEPRRELRPATFQTRLADLVLTWFLAGLAALLLWPTKWPQYTLIVVTPLCLAGGLAMGAAWRWLRRDREYWGPMSLDVLPREFWVAIVFLIVLTGALGIWRSVVRHRQLRGWTIFNRETSPLPSNIVQAVAVDASGRVWLGTARGVAVLERFEGSEPAVWRRYHRANSGLPDNDVSALMVGAGGEIWIGTRAGLSRFDPQSEAWRTWSTDGAPRAIAPTASGQVWVATLDGVTALAPDGTWQTYTAANSPLPGDAVFDVAVQETTADTRVWFATDRGVAALSLAANTWMTFTTQNSGLTWDAVADIAIDAQGAVWFATYGRGVSALQADGRWVSYTVHNANIPWNMVTTVAAGCPCEGQTPRLWFGTEGPGASLGQQLAALDEQAGRWRVFGHRNSGLPDSPVSDIAVQCLAAGDTCQGERVWIATYTDGVALYEAP